MVQSNYNLKKAAERLLWRFKIEKGFTPNKNDKNALNTVLNWINREKEVNIHERAVILFSKLYIYILNQNIEYYKTDVLENEPQKEISKLLDLPLENFYEAFYSKLKDRQLDRMLERVEKQNDKTFTKQELKEYFDHNFSKEHLNHMITEALNRF